MAGDGEREGDGGVGPHGSGDHQAGGLVVELGEPVAMVAAFFGVEGVGEPRTGGHTDDKAAVEAVCPGAEVPCGTEVGAEAGVVATQYPEVCVRLVPVADGAGAVGGQGGVCGSPGDEGQAEGGVAGGEQCRDNRIRTIRPMLLCSCSECPSPCALRVPPPSPR